MNTIGSQCIGQALPNPDWELTTVVEKKSVQSLHSTGANIWGRNLEVNKEAREQVKDRTKSDGTKNLRTNVKRQEESGVDQRTNGGRRYSS